MIHLENFQKYNESLIIDDLLLTEGFSDIKSKVLKYLRRGVLTASILICAYDSYQSNYSLKITFECIITFDGSEEMNWPIEKLKPDYFLLRQIFK